METTRQIPSRSQRVLAALQVVGWLSVVSTLVGCILLGFLLTHEDVLPNFKYRQALGDLRALEARNQDIFRLFGDTAELLSLATTDQHNEAAGILAAWKEMNGEAGFVGPLSSLTQADWVEVYKDPQGVIARSGEVILEKCKTLPLGAWPELCPPTGPDRP